MANADPKHPKGKHYTEDELKKHRDNWYTQVRDGIYSQKERIYEDDETAEIEIPNSAGGTTVIIDRKQNIEKVLKREILENYTEIIEKGGTYSNSNLSGYFSFDYSNNNGDFTIGYGEYAFTTHWSSSGVDSVHAYKNGKNIEKIARIRGPIELSKELFSGEYDFSSRTRRVNIGDAVLWKNVYGNYALTKVVAVAYEGRDSEHDEVTCEYIIRR